MDINSTLLGTSILATGLMSGLLYGWTVSVIPGTRRIDAPSYVDTMQNINKAIINPAFVIPFMAIPAVLAAAAIVQFRHGDQRRAWLLVSAAATYVVGVLGVTFGGNIPLNDALETFNLRGSTEQAIENRRRTYETPWNRWHYFRTAASAAAFVLASTAAIVSVDAE